MDVKELIEARKLPPPPTRRALRLAAGLSLEDVAQLAGVNRSTVSRWERDLREPRGATRELYARLLNEIREAISRAA